MYYEEKVIDGVLHHRADPHGKWIAFSSKRLTQMIIELKEINARLVHTWLDKAEDKL